MGYEPPRRLVNKTFFSPSDVLKVFWDFRHSPTGIHWHEFDELTFILSGNGYNAVNGEIYSLRPGSIFLLTPTDFHDMYPEEGDRFELVNVIFTEEMLDEELKALLFHDFYDMSACFEAELYDSIRNEFARMWKESKHERAGGRLMMRGSLQHILIELYRCCNREQKLLELSKSDRQAAMHRSLVFIHHHFREPITLKDAAGEAHLASNYFSECFRSMTGTPFRNYVQELRLEFAKSLLKATRMKIIDVCHMSGFNSLAHFERSFKQKFGASPRTFITKNHNR